MPASNLLGAEGTGFFHLVDKLPQERLSTAVAAMAAAEAAAIDDPAAREARYDELVARGTESERR